MVLGWLRLMSIRDLLVGASTPFRWNYSEADWFIQSTGFESVVDFKSFLALQGSESAFDLLSETLAHDEALENVRSGPALTEAFKLGWSEYELGVSRPPPQRVNLSAVSPCGGGGFSGRSQAPSPAANVSAGRTGTSLPGGRQSNRTLTKRRLPVGAESASQLRSSKTRRLQKEAISIAQDQALAAKAVEALRDNFYAQSTVASHLAEVALYNEICEARSMVPFPISHDSLELFAGVLVDAGYCPRSVPQYVSAIIRQQRLMHLPIPPELLDWKAIVLRAAKRGSGDAFRVSPFTSRMLMLFRDLAFVSGHVQQYLFRILTVAWFFVLRSDEAIGSETFRGLTPASFEFSDFPSKKVTIILNETKTNSEGLICKRTLSCCCSSSPRQVVSDRQKLLPLCPYCAAKLLKQDHLASYNNMSSPFANGILHEHVSPNDQPLRPRDGSPPLKSSHLLAFMRKGLSLLQVKTTDDTGRELFGTHSLRRGAAQALVAAGWSLEAIKFFGRWLSSCVELYLLSVPMDLFGTDVSASMLGHVSLEGVNSRSASKPDFVGAQRLSFKKSSLSPGVKLQALLPDLVSSELAEGDLDPSSGWLHIQIESILPSLPQSSVEVLSDVMFHESIRREFPHDFSDLSKRKASDSCALISVAPDHPLVAVCFKRLLHKFS